MATKKVSKYHYENQEVILVRAAVDHRLQTVSLRGCVQSRSRVQLRLTMQANLSQLTGLLSSSAN